MENTPRPWWAPDAQSFALVAILVIAAGALFTRMYHPSNVDDKILDMMITITFSTCLVTVFQYLFGSSRGSAAKDEMQSRIVEKAAGTGPGGPIVPTNGVHAVAPVVTTTVLDTQSVTQSGPPTK